MNGKFGNWWRDYGAWVAMLGTLLVCLYVAVRWLGPVPAVSLDAFWYLLAVLLYGGVAFFLTSVVFMGAVLNITEDREMHGIDGGHPLSWSEERFLSVFFLLWWLVGVAGAYYLPFQDLNYLRGLLVIPTMLVSMLVVFTGCLQLEVCSRPRHQIRTG